MPDLQCEGSVFTPDAHAHAYFARAGWPARGRNPAPHRPSSVRSNKGEKKGAPPGEAASTQRRGPATGTLGTVHRAITLSRLVPRWNPERVGRAFPIRAWPAPVVAKAEERPSL